MPRYGLIGERLSHSHSPAIHKLLAAYTYELFELNEWEIRNFLHQGDIGGLNVTIPYKQTVIPLCDTLSDAAKRIGSVNTLVYDSEGNIAGHNTDYDGFTRMAKRAGIHMDGKKVLILGTGGTSRTAAVAAHDMGAREIAYLSRSGDSRYENRSQHMDAEILINTTPVGMYPHGDGQLISLTDFPKVEGVIDVIYNPLRTRLVMQAMARGIPATGGLPMLVYQAARAVELFLGTYVAEEKAEATLRALRAQVENIVLIGMPGCGKTSIGKAIAELSGRTLYDTDDIITALAGKSIPDIFMEDGEAAFRMLERQAVMEAGAHSGVIIATGGGAVLAEENRLPLSQNGRIYHITRARDRLATKGRPLSTNLANMERERMPLYRAASNVTIDNDAAIEDVARMIWEELQ